MRIHQTKRSTCSILALAVILFQVLAGCGRSPAPAVQPENTAQPSPTTPRPAKPFTYLRIAPPQDGVKAFGRVELVIETDGAAANPFDPAEVDLSVEFRMGERAIRVPAFFYQAFNRATLQPDGAPAWMARFTPDTPGEWTAQAVLAQGGLTSEPVSFRVDPDPQARGFVRINRQDGRYFQYDSGDFFFPVGLNMGWAGSDVLGDYERWLDRFTANGGSLVRIWMASWSFGLEWNDTGLGDYTQRMWRAWLLDQVFQMAEERGVVIMLCLVNHGAFSATTNAEWDQNPYNAKLGGPLLAPEEFVTNRQAIDLFQRRVRYIAARWAYSTSLFAWEWWNEIQWTPIKTDALRPWLSEMTAYLRGLDPYNHLVTHSTSDGDKIWTAPELQIVQQHDYSGQFMARTLDDSYEDFQKLAPGKPVLLGEYGANTGGETKMTGTIPVHLHNGLWAPPFHGYAGTGMYWWWDLYIDPNNLWGQFRPVAGFFQGENLAGMQTGSPRLSNQSVTALSLQSPDRALVYVVHNKYNLTDLELSYFLAGGNRSAGAGWTYQPAPVENVQVTLRGMKDGTYTVYFFDTHSGKYSAGLAAAADGGNLTISLPPVTSDIAVKVLPEGAARPVDVPDAVLPPAPTAAPAPAQGLLEGFEGAQVRWKAGILPDYKDSTALQITPVGEHVTEGVQSYALAYGPPTATAPKAIFYLNAPFDLSTTAALRIDVYNDGSAQGIGLSLSTGSAWTWQETGMLPLAPGAQTITFDLTAAAFKSAATNWSTTARLKEPAQVQRIAIILYPTQAGTVTVDNLNKR